MDLFPWFQPIIEIASGRVAGYEALARRYDGNGVAVSAAPLLFADDLAPQARLELDRNIRRQALARFAAEAAPDQFLTLNLSPEWIDALHPDEPLPTLAMIHEYGIDPAQVAVEITELGGDVELIGTLAQRYREAGVKVAFDDFGAGFQQLDRLLVFTPDIIKLDMRMFQDERWSHRKSALMQLVGDIGARLGARVVCEGVETEEEFMLALHCNASYIQGYIFSPARAQFMPAQAQQTRLKRLLSQHLDLAMNEVTQRQWHMQRLHTQLLGLRDQLQSAGVDLALKHYCPEPGLLRLYLCNRSGEQISANYSFTENQWQQDVSVVGNNWSWRPYFYQLVSSADYARAVLRSSAYVDIATGQRCYTISLALDERRILLVDLLDEVDESCPMSLLSDCNSDLMALPFASTSL